jgi:hypothetical protein
MQNQIEAFSGNPNRIIVSSLGVSLFNAHWPTSNLRDRAYWFEFDSCGNLIDTDVPEHDDGNAAVALVNDCGEFFLNGTIPEWVQ